MNHIYKTVWNASLQNWVAVSELARGKGKSSKKIGAGQQSLRSVLDCNAQHRKQPPTPSKLLAQAIGLAMLALGAAPAWSACPTADTPSTTIADGETVSTTCTLTTSQSLTVESGGIANGSPAVQISGNGNSIINSGSISSTLRGIDTSLMGDAGYSLTNNVDATISGPSNGIRNVFATIENLINHGSILSSGGAAIQNQNFITSGTTIANLNNSATGIIRGANAGITNTDSAITTLTNAGEISATSGSANGAIRNTSGSTIGTLDNSGTITSAGGGVINDATSTITNFINSGTISTITPGGIAINNLGTITNGITNTGLIDGSVALNGATLNLNGTSGRVTGAVTGAVTGSPLSTVNVNGTFTTENTFNVGNFNVANDGMLTLKNQVTSRTGQIGFDPGAQSTVIVDGAGSEWKIGLTLEVGYDGKGTLTISNDGIVEANEVVVDSQNTGSTVNIGAAEGDEATTAGTLLATSVNIAANSGDLVFNHTNTTYNFAPAIIGGGTVKLLNGTTSFNIANLTAFTGEFLVDGGTLSIPDAQTLTLGGNYTQTDIGILRIGVSDDTTYGKLVVIGTATLPSNAKIDVNVADPDFSFTSSRLEGIITAGTLVSDGTFAVTDNSVLFDFNAVKDGNSVDLTLVATGGAGDTGEIEQIITSKSNTPALGAARALDTIINNDTTGPIASLFVSFTNEEQVNTAVSQTLPLLTGGSQIAATSALTGMNRVVQARIESNRGLSSGDHFYGDEKFWLKPFGSWADQDDRKGVSGFNSNTAGLAFGGDTTIFDSTRLGISFAYAKSSVDSNSKVAPNSAKVDVYQLIGYGSHALDDSTEVNFQLGLGQNRNKGTRNLTSFGLQANSSYDSLVATAGAGVGRSFELNKTTAFTPSVRADYSWIQDDGYTETGAGALNLKVNRRTTDELILAVDGKLTHEIKQGVTLSTNLGLGYDALNSQASMTSSFAGAPGVAFTTEGLKNSPWLARGGLGLASQTAGGMEISARYDAEYRQDFLNQTASIKLRWAF